MHQVWQAAGLSLVVSAVAVTISAAIGLPLGVALGLVRFPGKRLVAGLVQTGMALPPVVVGLAVYLLLSRSGPLGVWGWLFTPRAMILAQVLLDIPVITGITMAAAAAVPRELAEQVRSLGATRWQVGRVILREARAGVVLALASAFGRSFSEVGAVWLVGGNIAAQTRVLTTAIVLETNKGDFGLALQLGGLLLGLALLINLIVLRQEAGLPR